MPELLDFVECDNCRVKPGTPLLCGACLQNREAIIQRDREIERLTQVVNSRDESKSHAKWRKANEALKSIYRIAQGARVESYVDAKDFDTEDRPDA